MTHGNDPHTPQNWWVSGATGSWGTEIIKQLLAKPPSEVQSIVAFCRGEYRAFQLTSHFNDPRLTIYLGDIRDTTRVEHSLRGIQYAIHGAALKRIDAATFSPTEMASVNIEGTISVIDGCIAQGVKKAFYISTDKACEPTTFYGASKLIGESLWLSARDLQMTTFIAARFGNALNSTGSVLPIWREQMRRGEPVTMRDPAMTRFIMALPWAASFLLHFFAPAPTYTPDVHTVEPGLTIPILSATTIQLLKDVFCGDEYPTIYHPRIPGEKLHERLYHTHPPSNESEPITKENLLRMMKEAGL